MIAIIPARAGSKGVPGKNIKLLGNKPLIAYSIEAALACKKIKTVIVTTDDENIAEIAKQYGAEVPFLRPAELANDSAKSIDVVIHTLTYLKQQNRTYDAMCLLQPTSPFRSKTLIDTCIEKFNNQNLDSLVTVLPVPTEFNPHWVFESNNDGLLSISTGDATIVSRRQDLPKAYFRDGSVYLTKTSVLLNQHSFFGKKIGFIETNPEWHVNIDLPEDWTKATEILKTFSTSCVE